MTDARVTDATDGLPLDEAGARRLTSRIKLLLGPFLDQRDKLLAMVTEAREGDAHLALGYRSWSEYMSVEFQDHLPRLNMEDRRALVGELADAGMPTRAIATVVGKDQSTVVRDLAANRGDDQDVMHGASPDRGSTSGSTDPEVRSESAPVGNPTPDREVTGRDGKTYPAKPRPAEPERKPRRRGPLTDSYRNALYKLQKAAESLERLHADDRFAANREALNERHWRTVSNLGALMNSVEGDLDGSINCSECGGRVLPNIEFLSKCGDCQ